ncbi:MAG: hypothetical protein HC915_09550, partial [Anaerolineae bacterium]|nr:hypothetical protein [Anaerolineae bacterium]
MDKVVFQQVAAFDEAAQLEGRDEEGIVALAVRGLEFRQLAIDGGLQVGELGGDALLVCGFAGRWPCGDGIVGGQQRRRADLLGRGRWARRRSKRCRCRRWGAGCQAGCPGDPPSGFP